MVDEIPHPSLRFVRVQSLSLKLKAAKSDWPEAEKRSVLSRAEEILDAIPGLEAPVAKGRRKRVLDFVSKLSDLETLVDRLDKASKGPSPEATAARARKTFKREPPTISGAYWGRHDEEAGRKPFDELDNLSGDDRGETGEVDPDGDDEGLYSEPDDGD
jgi:hypothetical protein